MISSSSQRDPVAIRRRRHEPLVTLSPLRLCLSVWLLATAALVLPVSGSLGDNLRESACLLHDPLAPLANANKCPSHSPSPPPHLSLLMSSLMPSRDAVFYRKCLINCQKSCSMSEKTGAAAASRGERGLLDWLLGWSCQEDCQHACQWDTIAYLSSSESADSPFHGTIPQFYGKVRRGLPLSLSRLAGSDGSRRERQESRDHGSPMIMPMIANAISCCLSLSAAAAAVAWLQFWGEKIT